MKNLIFDFGKVIANFDENEVYKDYTSNETDSEYIHKLFEKKEVWKEMDKGVSIEKIKKKLLKRINPRLEKPITNILKNWINYLEIDEEMVNYIIYLKEKGFNIYLLSNISKQFYDIRDKYIVFFSKFNYLYISSDRGYIKPTYMVYFDFLKITGLKAEDCAFIDDNQTNLETAKELGFTTFQFKGDINELKVFVDNLN